MQRLSSRRTSYPLLCSREVRGFITLQAVGARVVSRDGSLMSTIGKLHMEVEVFLNTTRRRMSIGSLIALPEYLDMEIWYHEVRLEIFLISHCRTARLGRKPFICIPYAISQPSVLHTPSLKTPQRRSYLLNVTSHLSTKTQYGDASVCR
ncbi:hypothetical protein WAI453_003583 [Rhynchosporium graminicola]